MTKSSQRTTEILLAAPAEARERFWSQIEIQPDSCWNRIGCVDRNGYTRVQLERLSHSAHRAAYTWAKGQIPDGLVIDHLCRNRRCVNPDHLEAVTHDVNMARGIRPTATHCKWGHEFTPENSGTRIQANGNPARDCRTCRRNYGRKQLTRQEAAR